MEELFRGEFPQRLEELVHLLPNRRSLLFPDRQLALVLPVLGRRHHGEGIDVVDACKERLQAVVVALRDRIKLVVVALGASKGEPQERGSDDAGDVVQRFLPRQQKVLLVRLFGIVPVEGSGDPGVRALRPQLVPCDLFLHERVVGLVGVEGVADIVPVAPGVGPGDVLFETPALRVASQVEPVAAPALSVVGRRQEALDQPLVGFRGIVRDECGHVLGRGWQAGQIEEEPSDEGRLVGLRRWRQALVGELGHHERVHRVADPSLAGNRWRARALDRLERPVGALLG